MMKVRLGRSKEGVSLRPLTEKEIQQRLYGKYAQGESGLKERMEEAEFLNPSRKEKTFILDPEVKIPSVSLSKVWSSIPWREVSSLLLKGFQALGAFLGTFFQKAATGWGVSILVVVSLFLAIHALNSYRATAMKISRPVPRVEALPEVAAPFPVPAVKPPVPNNVPPTPVEKPYVVQVCSYDRPSDAERLVEEMVGANLPAFAQPLRRTSGKVFYPVFLGRFETPQEAQSALREFLKKPIAKDFSDSFVRSL